MAKSSKTNTGKTKIDKAVDDAVEITSTAETDGPTDPVDAADTTLAGIMEIPDDDHAALEMVIVDESIADEAPADVQMVPAQADKSSSAGFLPMLLGGVAAGAIGYGIATYYPMSNGSDDLAAQISLQAEQIAALQAELGEAPDADLSAVEGQITALSDSTSAQLDEMTASIEESLSDLDARLVDVEKRPGADGTLSDTALAAYQRELEELRSDLDAQQSSVMAAAAQAEADLATAREEAAALEAEAMASAEAAVVRAAINRIATAVETGASFADALSDLPVADVPAALSDVAETGVATTAQLAQSFPAAARKALATARSEGVSDDAGGFGGFFRSQFDVRSTAPQEGSGPDAILSRAEAAAKEGRVADALAEIEVLPEVARAEMTDWTAQATERADVLNAIATFSETYN